jgi:Phage Mu protein F like protein
MTTSYLITQRSSMGSPRSGTTSKGLTLLARVIGEELAMRGLTVKAEAAPQSPNSQHAARALLRHAQLQSVANWIQTQADERLAQLAKEVASEARKHDPTRDAKQLEPLLSSIDKRVENAFSDLGETVGNHLNTIAQVTATKVKAGIRQHHGHETGKVDLGKISSTPVLGATVEEHFEKMASDVAFKYGAAVRQGVKAGDTLDELIGRFNGESKVKASATVKAAVLGVALDLAVAAAESVNKVIQAAVTAYANEVTAMVGDTLEGESREAMGWEWVAVLDQATCEQCEFYSGNRWTAEYESVDEAPEFPDDPPLHFGCRCSLVPVNLSEAAAPERNFDSWLSQYSRSEQVAAFGEANLRAYHRGDITANQLIGQKTNIMSLKEFEEAN